MHLIQSMRKGNKHEDLSTIFCSELVAAAYMCMGWLGDHTASSNFVPADFSTERSPAAGRGVSLCYYVRSFVCGECFVRARTRTRLIFVP